jgi:sialate O-acetylesterase
MKRFTLTLLLSALMVVPSMAQLVMPKVFGNHMVLQRNKPVNVWGWAAPKETVTVKFHGQSVKTAADKNGKWKVALKPEQAGGPYSLAVKGKKESLNFDDILVGEVWICSGQSNMEWPVRLTDNSDKAIAAANYPQIRHIKVPNTVAAQPKDDITGGEWKVCSPETVGDFTAVGYYFAEKIQKELNVPVGLINTSWGGTHSETWTSREAFENNEEFKSMIAKMPNLDLDQVAKEKGKMLSERLIALQGTYPSSASEIATWSAAETDDSKWPTMTVPGLWESQQLPDLDGTVWLRYSFELSEAEAGKSATLWAGMIDDSDETYINGVRVGSTQNNWNQQREYRVGENILKQGKNVIAIRVVDTGGGGGIHGDASGLHLVVGTQNVPLTGKWLYHVESLAGGSSVGPNDYPTLLFNAMINPLVNYTIEGALWYQGESNAGRAYQYRTAFPLMINDWRKHWGQGDFPFYFVQLASWNADNGNSEKGSSWAELREAQTMTLSLPQTGMAVTTDIGNPTDIHPRNKKDVGLRLAAVALAGIYQKQIVSRGPVYNSMTVSGSRATITFKNVPGGLMVKDKYGYIRGFEVSGKDGKFYPAQAFVDGINVIVSSKSVAEPAYVRFGWSDENGECNLYNAEGFPAEPFRTDSLKGITEGNKFWGN